MKERIPLKHCDIPAIQAMLEKQSVFESRLREAREEWLKSKEDVRQFIAGHYAVDVDMGDWEIDLDQEVLEGSEQ